LPRAFDKAGWLNLVHTSSLARGARLHLAHTVHIDCDNLQRPIVEIDAIRIYSASKCIAVLLG
jgi:hypothetical protein